MENIEKIRITESEANSNETLRFIKNYRDKSEMEMFRNVCILEESKLSKHENILCNIFRFNKNTVTTTYSLLEMKNLCESMISYQSKEIEFFRSQLKLIQLVLKKI
ncbi:hypothetical protein [Xanthomarina gelatinilytica]|uniref:hypothetical protein n=1 Tax=Xanthomarina gelatinilytica TaxID=1137281 RepID=UPI003AA87636